MTGEPGPEQALAAFITGLDAATLPAAALLTVQRVVLAALGTGVAGAAEDGIAELRALLVQRGGRAEARCLVFGDALPAVAAAQFNGTLCRALDFCDAMAPGPHAGAALLPAALAAAELRGGCPGAEFLAALAVGLETGARFNLSESQYDGFDPTGVAMVFAATAGAARVLGLTPPQTVFALGLAFNRCGGSFQSHIDGSLGVRLQQGWVAAAGVECAQMALAGLTGPHRFLSGVYGYPHLFGRGRLAPADMLAGLSTEWRLERTMFKKYPSCGATQGLTELVLGLARQHGLQAAGVAGVQVTLPPYSHKLVGHPWKLGPNPRVDAQFSAQYCVANALVRGGSVLAHFHPAQIVAPEVQAFIPRVQVQADAALDARGHTAVDVVLTTTAGVVHRAGLDIAPGFPGNGLTAAQQQERFAGCLAYAPRPLPAAQVQAFQAAVQGLHTLPDARVLVAHLLPPA